MKIVLNHNHVCIETNYNTHIKYYFTGVRCILYGIYYISIILKIIRGKHAIKNYIARLFSNTSNLSKTHFSAYTASIMF